MIDEVHIRDVALIREAFFEPASGMTVVTGETGAGKTALLAACRLLTGQRADASLVRAGCEELRVEGRFMLPAEALAEPMEEAGDGAEEEGGAGGEGEARPRGDAWKGGQADAGGRGAVPETGLRREVVASRRIASNGRSRAMFDGELSSVKRLAQTLGPWVDICAQHEHQSLLEPLRQRELLDRWGGAAVAGCRQAYGEAWAQVERIERRMAQLEELARADQEQLDRARFVVEQIGAVDPQPGEYERLLEEMPRHEHAESLVRSAQECVLALQGEGEQPGALELLEGALAALDSMVQVDGALAPLTESVREAFFALDDAARETARYGQDVEFSPLELEERQRRLADLQALLRGFGPGMDAVFEALEQASGLLDAYESRDEAMERCRAERAEAERALEEAAGRLAQARADVAPAFCQAVGEQLARLEMGAARIEVRLEELPRDRWSAWGPHALELLFAPAAGVAPQRLSKIASGGELSRVMLALKVVLGSCDHVETLVFDEVDAGVGGHTATSLGAVLKDLALTHQVIVVTHLAQVAVLADKHYVASKEADGDGSVRTELGEVRGERRVEEVARMLSGDVDDASLAHARSLLESAV